MALTRENFLRETAVDAAHVWEKGWRRALASDGRRVEGGWPGTIPEARMRVGAHVGKALLERSMSALTHEEFDRVASIMYEEARRCWRGAGSP
jgi:hypothetical protein